MVKNILLFTIININLFASMQYNSNFGGDYDNFNNNSYQGNSGNSYQYDLNNSYDNMDYQTDTDAQRRDLMNLNIGGGTTMDQGYGQYGGGIND